MGRSPSLDSPFSKLLKYNRICQFTPVSRRQIRRQLDGPVAYADEAVDLGADGFEKPPHLAVAAFFQDHPIPAVAAGCFSLLTDRGERCLAVFQLDSEAELLKVG